MEKWIAIKNFAEVRWLRKFKDKEELRTYQKKMLYRHMAFLKRHSPYFRFRKEMRFKEIPLMNKQIMMDHFDEMNTLGLKKDRALSIAIESEHSRDFNPTYDGVSVGLSSGTSGHRGLFVVSDKERMEWAGAMLAKMLPKGHILHHRIAFFLRADNNLYETINSSVIRFQFFDLMKPLQENLREVEQLNPTILVAPASVLKDIAKAMHAGKVRLNPEKVISVAEVLNEADETFLKEVFRKEIIYQVYQCTEGFLAYTCSCGRIHLNEDIVVVEKQWLDGKRFIPIVTDFRRTSQPIVRYRLNDVLVEGEQNCPCGNPATVIERIEGREDDIFLFPARRAFTGTEYVRVYPDFISRCLVYVEAIRNYRVVQLDPSTIEIQIEQMEGEEVMKEQILREFERLAKKQGFIMPKILFADYSMEPGKKVKRVERKFS